MRSESSSEIVSQEVFSGTWYLVAIPGLMILFTLIVYAIAFLKKRYMGPKVGSNESLTGIIVQETSSNKNPSGH
jgi:hypothetical protein